MFTIEVLLSGRNSTALDVTEIKCLVLHRLSIRSLFLSLTLGDGNGLDLVFSAPRFSHLQARCYLVGIYRASRAGLKAWPGLT